MKRFSDIKLFCLKLSLFVVLVIIAHSIISVATISRVVPAPINALNSLIDRKTEIIFLSDSTHDASDPSDLDKRSISEILKDKISPLTIGSTVHAAYNVDVYRDYCRYIVRQKNRPKMIVMTINLRSFSSSMSMQPVFQFEKEKFFLSHDSPIYRFLYRPLAVLKGINVNTVSRQSYLDTPVYEGEKLVGTVKDFDNPTYLDTASVPNIRNKMVWFYMYKLDQNSKRVKAIAEIAEILNKNGIKPLFYVSPCQFDLGNGFVGPEFAKNIKSNTAVIASVLSARGANLVDLSVTIPSQCFIKDGPYPGEHLKQEGREFVAEKLSEEIHRQLM